MEWKVQGRLRNTRVDVGQRRKEELKRLHIPVSEQVRSRQGVVER
jgi:hypothetical protein